MYKSLKCFKILITFNKKKCLSVDLDRHMNVLYFLLSLSWYLPNTGKYDMRLSAMLIILSI